MIDFKILKKYFIQDSVIRTIVSIVTGIFIVYFNVFGGLLIVRMFVDAIFGEGYLDLLRIAVIIPLGIATGYLLLKQTVKVTFRFFRNDGMETYSLLRFILLISIIIYLVILGLYFILYLINSVN